MPAVSPPEPPRDDKSLSCGIPTFADLIAASSADRELAPARCANVRSALTTFCKRLHRHPAETLASANHIRRHAQSVHPCQIGLSAKRWQNVLSDVRFALDRYGPKSVRRLKTEDLIPVWSGLLERLTVRTMRIPLLRFIKFCSIQGVAPEMVDLAVFDRYEGWLDAVEFSKDPARVGRAAIAQWNKACTTVADWPGRVVDKRPARDTYSLPWDNIDPAFRADTELYLGRLGIDAWDDDEAPLRPLRASSIESHRQSLRAAYSILVHQGRARNSITGLVHLVDPENVAAIIDFFRQRNGGRHTSQTAGMAALLLAVARHHVKADPLVIRKLQRLKAKVSPKRRGLTEKNKAMLRQFDDLANVERLLMLPMDLMRTVAKLDNKKPREAALLAQAAVALEILIMAAPRLGNLASIELETDISWRGDTVLVSIPGDRVKNGEDLEFLLQDESVALIDRYLNCYRPRLSNGSAWLFPGTQPGRHKCKAAQGRQIARTVFERTGLRITPHQFRHVVARLWLDENPGSYELLRQLLRHRSLDTTTSSYIGFENRKATEHYDRFIWRQRMAFRQRRMD